MRKFSSHDYTFVYLLASFYITADLASYILVYKLTYVGQFIESGATFIFPLTYLFSDIIAEVYGYNFVRKIIWCGLFSELLFCSLIYSVSIFPSPPHWQNETIFLFISHHLFRTFFTSIIATTTSEFINVYAITKWRILTRGKYFWLRSVGSTLVGELVYSILVITFLFWNLVGWHTLLTIMLASYLVKVVFAMLGGIPATILVNFLKRVENIDEHEPVIDFNPFKVFPAKPTKAEGSN